MAGTNDQVWVVGRLVGAAGWGGWLGRLVANGLTASVDCRGGISGCTASGVFRCSPPSPIICLKLPFPFPLFQSVVVLDVETKRVVARAEGHQVRLRLGVCVGVGGCVGV